MAASRGSTGMYGVGKVFNIRLLSRLGSSSGVNGSVGKIVGSSK